MIETIHINGYWLRAALRPGTGIPLLICNGWGSNLEPLDDLVDAIAERPVLRFDAPGSGGSQRPWRPLRMPEIAALLEGLIRHYGFEQVDVAGYSWGGALAQELAKRNPTVVRRLVLLATSPGHIMVPALPNIIPAFADHRWLTNWRDPALFFERDFLCRIGPRLFGGRTLRRNPMAILPLLRKLEAPSAKGLLWQVAGTIGYSSLPWLHRLQQETLILAGRDDRVVNPLNALILRSLIPRARLEWVAGGHLFPVLDSVETTAVHIDRFLDAESKVVNITRRGKRGLRPAS